MLSQAKKQIPLFFYEQQWLDYKDKLLKQEAAGNDARELWYFKLLTKSWFIQKKKKNNAEADTGSYLKTWICERKTNAHSYYV